MPNDKLDNLVKIGKLKPERATADEIAGLIRSGEARLAERVADEVASRLAQQQQRE